MVVTQGERGAVLVGEATRLRTAAYPVDYVDGTGSGDAFTAGFIHGLLAKADLETCLRWGSGLGASCVRAAGASTGVFTSAELAAFCESRPLAIEILREPT